MSDKVKSICIEENECEVWVMDWREYGETAIARISVQESEGVEQGTYLTLKSATQLRDWLNSLIDGENKK